MKNNPQARKVANWVKEREDAGLSIDPIDLMTAIETEPHTALTHKALTKEEISNATANKVIFGKEMKMEDLFKKAHEIQKDAETRPLEEKEKQILEIYEQHRKNLEHVWQALATPTQRTIPRRSPPGGSSAQ